MYAAATTMIIITIIAAMVAVFDNALLREKAIFNLPSFPGLSYT